uniref:MARVEL domain-containing protein n=1 Tax=Heliothis virescens TaxID=7102 RepID=A0A2A4JIP9_HELVI
MCEIFPEVESCCMVASIRVGMLLIAVLAICTGTLSLSVMEQRTSINLKNVMNIYENVTHISKPDQALSELSNLISTSLSAISVIFILAGLFLLFATLTDQEGFAQMFVWLTFLCIVIGFICVLAIGFECVLQTKCLLGNMDWLSAATSLVVMVFYLFMWFYFVVVANSYVLNGYT